MYFGMILCLKAFFASLLPSWPLQRECSLQHAPFLPQSQKTQSQQIISKPLKQPTRIKLPVLIISLWYLSQQVKTVGGGGCESNHDSVCCSGTASEPKGERGLQEEAGRGFSPREVMIWKQAGDERSLLSPSLTQTHLRLWHTLRVPT